ncbi:MAG: type II secretion system protein [Patescibacteria group bacterium]
MTQKIHKKTPGFTLMEILIAATIFAVMMVLVTATTTQAITYQRKLKAMRGVSENARRITDMLTRDIRQADDSRRFSLHSLEFRGLAILNCSDNSCQAVGNTAPETTEANALVVGLSDGVGFYLNSAGRLRYKKYSSLNQINQAIISEVASTPAIVDEEFETTLRLSGFAPSVMPATRQPFVGFSVEVIRRGENIADNAAVTIKSLATSRNYD